MLDDMLDVEKIKVEGNDDLSKFTKIMCFKKRILAWANGNS